MKTYSIIQPPFSLKFEDLSKNELKEYFQWFRAVMPERIAELTITIKQTQGFEKWEPDQTPASLDVLGQWFMAHVETRQRTKEERQEIMDRSPYSIEISDKELTNQTFSLAMDIGMYLSQVFLKNHPSLRWEQPLRNKKYIDFGQPVLIGFGPVPFNPVQILITLAYCHADGTHGGKRLREIYDYWSKRIGIAKTI